MSVFERISKFFTWYSVSLAVTYAEFKIIHWAVLTEFEDTHVYTYPFRLVNHRED